MKKHLLILLPALFLAACTASSPTPTAEQATAVPTVAPVVTELTPTAEAVAPDSGAPGDHIPDPNLIDKEWAWENRDPNGTDFPAIDVPNPEHYTLTFSEDGSFSARVDCNSVRGGYVTSPPDSIRLEPAPARWPPVRRALLTRRCSGFSLRCRTIVSSKTATS